MQYFYVPVVLRYFKYGLNWKFDFENKIPMKVSSRLQAQQEATKLYKLEKEKNLNFGKSVFSLYTVNKQEQKKLKVRYPKEEIFLGIEEPQMYVLSGKTKKQWIKSPLSVIYSRI